jgi:hypothetical protein
MTKLPIKRTVKPWHAVRLSEAASNDDCDAFTCTCRGCIALKAVPK